MCPPLSLKATTLQVDSSEQSPGRGKEENQGERREKKEEEEGKKKKISQGCPSSRRISTIKGSVKKFGCEWGGVDETEKK